MSCIFDEPLEPYWCEADWNCKDCPNWIDGQEPKLRAVIHANAEMHDDGDYYLRDECIDEIFDKYKEVSP